jgi:hypothetical protein
LRRERACSWVLDVGLASWSKWVWISTVTEDVHLPEPGAVAPIASRDGEPAVAGISVRTLGPR